MIPEYKNIRLGSGTVVHLGVRYGGYGMFFSACGAGECSTGRRKRSSYSFTEHAVTCERCLKSARHAPEQPAAVTLDGLNDFLAAYVTMETLAARHGWFNRFNSTHLLQEMELVAWRYKHQQLHPVNTRVRFSELVNCRAEVLWWAIEDARIDWQYGDELLDLPQLRGYSHKNERGEAIPREVQR